MLEQYRDAFIEELEDVIQQMDEEILLLEQEPSSTEHVQVLFRAVHTLKGSSAVMGYERMKQLTHDIEHILDQVRNQRLEVSDRLVNLLFETIDMLKLMREEIKQHNEIRIDASQLMADIHRFLEQPAASGSSRALVKLVSIEIDAAMQVRIVEAEAKGLSVYRLNVKLESGSQMKKARAAVLLHQLSSIGEVLCHIPQIEGNSSEDDSHYQFFQILFCGKISQEAIERMLLDLMDVEHVQVTKPEVMAAMPEAASPLLPAREESSAASERSKPQTIRVNVERLDDLMNMVGEMIIDQTRIRQLSRNLSQEYAGDTNVNALAEVSGHINRVIDELQASVMKIRMLPMENLFSRFPRMVRDLAQNLNKEVQFVMEGQETELDRTLIDEIGDPLIHLIRNAIDHGIEQPSGRLQAGKSAKGLVRIRAAHEDNQVVITIEDDGAGIDPIRMRQSAIKKGLMSEDRAGQLSDQEAIDLIFEPGFSTAAQISDVSGRGVGMDIVRSNIANLNGTIEVQTRKGFGTAFRIKLPLTLAIINGLVTGIHQSNRVFVLPMSNVLEIVRVAGEDIKTVRGERVVVIRDHILPVVWLHDLFHLPGSKEIHTRIPLVITGSGEKRIALAVDKLLGNQEIVIKSLGSYMGKIDGILGATILGNGQVALILEVAGLIQSHYAEAARM